VHRLHTLMVIILKEMSRWATSGTAPPNLSTDVCGRDSYIRLLFYQPQRVIDASMCLVLIFFPPSCVGLFLKSVVLMRVCVSGCPWLPRLENIFIYERLVSKMRIRENRSELGFDGQISCYNGLQFPCKMYIRGRVTCLTIPFEPFDAFDDPQDRVLNPVSGASISMV